MRGLFSFIFILISTGVFSQNKITLEECYDLVSQNYPIAKQLLLLQNQSALDSKIIENNKLPKFEFLAQASYQSDVTSLPVVIPNSNIKAPNKDQYKATFSVSQLIYNGGLTNSSVELKTADFQARQKQVEVNLYSLKKEVNQLYFALLMLQDRKDLLVANENQLKSKLSETQSGIKFGVLLPASDEVLEAELLKMQQQFEEIKQRRIALLTALSSLTGTEIIESRVIEKPNLIIEWSTEIYRPELELFNLEKAKIESSEVVLSKTNTPKVLGFATGGYGNPGLNMLDNSFQAFYLAGVKLNWNVFDWNSMKKQRESLLINKDILDTQEQMFRLNTQIEIEQIQAEINTYKSFIESDKQIIDLRKSVLKSSDSQLKNGVITASAYLIELTKLHEAKINLSTHTIQLLLAEANLKIAQGN